MFVLRCNLTQGHKPDWLQGHMRATSMSLSKCSHTLNTSLVPPFELSFIFLHHPFIFSLLFPVFWTKIWTAIIIHENMCLEINGEVYCAVLINCLKFFFYSPPSLDLCTAPAADRLIYLVPSWVLTEKEETGEKKRRDSGSQAVKSLGVDILIAPLQPGWRELSSCRF